MLSALKEWFSPSPHRAAAHRLYTAAVQQARQPFLYERYAIPDTLDGRFDAIVLHLFLLMQRLRKENTAYTADFVRKLQEIFIADMDRSLREMGVGDTGVGKRIRPMASALLGRLSVYEACMDDESMVQALHRNVYRSAEGLKETAGALSHYAEEQRIRLEALAPTQLMAHGMDAWP